MSQLIPIKCPEFLLFKTCEGCSQNLAMDTSGRMCEMVEGKENKNKVFLLLDLS